MEVDFLSFHSGRKALNRNELFYLHKINRYNEVDLNMLGHTIVAGHMLAGAFVCECGSDGFVV